MTPALRSVAAISLSHAHYLMLMNEARLGWYQRAAMGATCVALLVSACFTACSSAQKKNAHTALELSRCVHEVLLDHLDDDINQPSTMAESAVDIVDRCSPLGRHYILAEPNILAEPMWPADAGVSP